MGNFLSACPRRNPGWAKELGVPEEYAWEGLDETKIDEYMDEKDKAFEEFKATEEGSSGVYDAEWVTRIHPQRRDDLKKLLLARAIAMVHILKPIEEQRQSMHKMQTKGFLPEGHFTSFLNADETCQHELKAILEESQLLAPEAPPNAIIHSAVQMYHQGHGRPQAAEDGSPKFEDVRRGFFKNASLDKAAKTVHGFQIGAMVEAHSLNTATMNGAQGVVKEARGDRVAIAFPDGSEKALKPANLKLVEEVPPAPTMPQIHPDAREPPMHRFKVEFQRAVAEPLGLALDHEPPLEEQQPGQESCMLIKNVLDGGYAKKFNESQEDEDSKLRPGDRIVCAFDGSTPEDQRKPVPSSQAILDVIKSGATPLIFFILRLLGPPLRFKMGQQVKANCGEKEGWLDGRVVAVWAGTEGEGRQPQPYVIRIKNADGRVVFAPNDHDDVVRLGEPRFKKDDDIVANYENGYQPGKIVEVLNKGTHHGYSIKLTDGDNQINAPEDLDCYLRPVARFAKGTKVLANVNKEFAPGTIDHVYHPEWVYAIRLDAGSVVFAPEDVDSFVKKR